MGLRRLLIQIKEEHMFKKTKKILLNKLESKSFALAVLIMIVGVGLRVLCTTRGYNYDMDSWRAVADVVLNHDNVYEKTNRYNYGPIWFSVLYLLDKIPFHFGDFDGLRLKVVLFLAFVDLGIFTIIYKRYNLLAGALFFLNPVSIVISGYHNQFDNFAILLGILSVILYSKRRDGELGVIALLILGLSLSVKHILFVFPLWMAFSSKGKEKIFAILIPYSFFIVSFLPFVSHGIDGIVHNVFLYRSYANAPFWEAVTPYLIYVYTPKFLLFVGSMLILGLYLKSRDFLLLFWLYTISVVVFSSAVANQYLAIAIPGIAVLWNRWYMLYSLVGGVYLAVEYNGLHFAFLQKIINWSGSGGYVVLVLLLFFGLLNTVINKEKMRRFVLFMNEIFDWLRNEVRAQIGSVFK